MTLNFSTHPIFPSPNPSEGGFIGSVREKGREGFGEACRSHPETNGCYDCGRDRKERGGAQNAGPCDPTYSDILSQLPSDPFEMDMRSTWTAAVAGWIEDLGDYGRERYGDYHFVEGINYLCNQAVWFPPEPGPFGPYSNDFLDKGLPGLIGYSSFGEFTSASDVSGRLFTSGWDVEGCAVNLRPEGQGNHEVECADQGKGSAFVSGRGEEDQAAGLLPEEAVVHVERSCQDGDGEPPHEGLIFALSYLEVKDLLSVERVCKRLRFAVQTDPLLWRCIHINEPLNEKLDDDGLLMLAQRAEGSLQCLNLVKCSKITDDGLKRVLESNPRITKLSVPECTRLSVDVLLNFLKLFKTPGLPGIRYLRIGGLYGVTQANYEELKLLVDMDVSQQPKAHKPRFYCGGRFSSSCDYDSAIDVEMCPKCQNLRLVYDCPAESCKGKRSEPCRGCTFCIARCAHCGVCIDDTEYEETFCLQMICSECWKDLESHEGQGMEMGCNKLVPFSSEGAGNAAGCATG